MTDTRKKSNRGDYEKEQQESMGVMEYYGNPANHYGKPVETFLPGNGLLGAKIHAMDLVNNIIDTEAFLRGTGSCNMVNPQTPATPELKYIKSLNYYENKVYVPEPLVVQKDQRPLWK
jgi:hypothetical protein